MSGYEPKHWDGPLPPPINPGPTAGPDSYDQGYDAGHADGYNEGRREADITGHLLRPHARHLLEVLPDTGCTQCAEFRALLEGLLP